jgi:hypothetical protein
MPSAADSTGGTRPKYAPGADAFVVHRGEQAYVSLADEAARTELALNPDVHILTGNEGVAFEHDLPFPMPPLAARRDTVGLGDVVSRITGRIGIRECSGCQGRRERMNALRVRKWWARAKV